MQHRRYRHKLKVSYNCSESTPFHFNAPRVLMAPVLTTRVHSSSLRYTSRTIRRLHCSNWPLMCGPHLTLLSRLLMWQRLRRGLQSHVPSVDNEQSRPTSLEA